MRPFSPSGTATAFRLLSSAAPRTASPSLSVIARSRTSLTTLALCARPSTSRIRATLPSPMMVAPAKVLMPFSCLLSGLTTISSVSLISSTTSPNCWPSACSTTMLTASPRSGPRDLHLRGFQFPVQIHQRQQSAAQPVDRRAVDHFNALARLLAFQAHQFQQADLRNRIAVAAAGHDQGRDDGQGQGNLHLERWCPRPAWTWTSTVPPIFSMLVFTTSMPTPRPETLVTFSAVEKPGQENQVDDFALGHAAPPGRR